MPDESDEEELGPPSEEYEKRDLTLIDAYTIGIHTAYLQLAGAHQHHLGGGSESGILSSLDELQNRLIETELDANVASQIEEFKSQIYAQHEGDSRGTPINEALGNRLKQNAQTWNNLLQEKISSERRIKIPDTGFLNLEDLMENPGILFRREVWSNMDEEPRRDLHEACHTLPILAPTATVMVSLRAVEHYLRKWYEEELNTELSRGTWGSVLDELMREFVADEDSSAPVYQQLSSVPGVLSNVVYLKEKRDEVMHPESHPSLYDAAITLFMVAGTISEIMEVLGEVPPSESDLSQGE